MYTIITLVVAICVMTRVSLALVMPSLSANVFSTQCKDRGNNLTLTVNGKRNISGHWEKDVKLDFDGSYPPKTWNIDFEEKSADAENYSFTASAQVFGLRVDTAELQMPLHVYHGDVRNYSEARKACEALGGHLAVINSEAEARLLSTMVKLSRDPRSRNYTLLGFDDITSEGNFVTVLGYPLASSGYLGWAKGEPNNLGFKLPNGTIVRENCGSMDLDGKLNDIPCHMELPFICEFFPSAQSCTP